MDVKFPNVTRGGVELNEDQTLRLLAMAGYEERDGTWYDSTGFPMPIREVDRWWRSERKFAEARDYRGPVYEPWPEVDLLGEADSESETVAILDAAPPTEAARYLSIADAEADRLRQCGLRATAYREPTVPSELARASTLVAGHYIRAAKAGVPSTLTPGEWLAIRESFKGRCAYCNCRATRLTLDHVVPFARGGPNVAANVVAACRPCNSSKHAHDLGEWLRSREFDEVAVMQRIADARAGQVTA